MTSTARKISAADYSYQTKIQSQILKRVREGKPGDTVRVVLAAGCGAGKTRMSTEVIKALLKAAGFRILVLSHGQTIIRTQFATALQGAGLKPLILEAAAQYDAKARLVVSLPHTLQPLDPKELGKFDVVFVDEAHQFYSVKNGMVAKLLAHLDHRAEVLLTATPSPFVRANQDGAAGFEILAVPQMDLVDAGVITDPDIFLLPTKAYRFGIKDYSRDDSLKRGVKLTSAATRRLMAGVISFLESRYGKTPFRYFQKTFIAAASQQQAEEILHYLVKEKGIRAVVSTSFTDPNAFEIQRFLMPDAVEVLIVVGRGVLGFDFPRMGATIDLSGTLNPDRLFQLLNRVSRRDGERSKHFIKVMPEKLMTIAAVATSCAVALGTRDVLLNYAGIYDEIPVPAVRSEEPDRRSRKSGEHKISPSFLKIPGFRLMSSVNLGAVQWTTFRKARLQLSGKTEWSFNAVLAEALKYQHRIRFMEGSAKAYEAARRHGWMKEVTAHMEHQQRIWDKETCRKEAARFKTRQEFAKGCNGAYHAAYRNGWLNEICAHMARPAQKLTREKWTKEKVMAVARKYTRKTHFKRQAGGAFYAARDRGWLDDACAHMVQRP
jgi:superfamily II DNA or RNA helicase